MALSRGGGGGGGGLGAVGGGVTWNKPRALVCHICGREYGTASLAIHLPQCQKMWLQREALKPKGERRPLPQAPVGLLNGPIPRGQKGIDAYNERAFNAFTDKTLVACPHCGRKFLEDRLKVHLRSCRPGNEAKPVKGKMTSAPAAAGDDVSEATAVPRTSAGGRPSVGRAPTMGAGAAAATRAESKMPAYSGGSGGVGDEIPIGRSGGGGGGVPPDIDESVPLDLAECNICGRKFAADRLAKHQTVCATHTAKEAKVRAKLAAKESKKPKVAEVKTEKTSWKEKHGDLIQSIRLARKTAAVIKAGGDIRSLPPPPPASNPDYIQCPTCGRRYNETAAARHIPKCKDIINKPKPPPARAATTTASPATAQRGPAPKKATPAAGARRGPPAATTAVAAGGRGYGSPATPAATDMNGYGSTYGGMSRAVGGGNGASLTTPPRTASGFRAPPTASTTSNGSNGSRVVTPTRSPMGRGSGGSASPNGGFPPIRPPSAGGAATGNGRSSFASSSSPASSRFCENCGAQRSARANFCGGCGQRHSS